MKALITYFLLVLSWQAVGQEVVSRQIGEGDQERYSLYLPQGYDETRLYPVIFIFDPMGRGSQAIQHFIPVAKTYGYILAASDETRNGRHTENFDLAARMINDVLDSYPILEKRMYLTGFSGGSRLASAIAVLSGQFEGVVGCGSGFSPNPGEQPRTDEFSYIGIVGDQDMNYAEMHEDYTRLRKWRMDNSLITFDGPHKWPDQAELQTAFCWLEFRADQKGLPSLWNDLKGPLFAQELKTIQEQDTVADIHLRKRVFRLSYTFPELFKDHSWTQTRGLEILEDEELKTQDRLEKSLIGFETAQVEIDNDRLLQFFLLPKKQYKVMLGHIEGRKRQLESAGGVLYRKQYRRLLRNMYANLYERGIGYGQLQTEQLERAYYSNELLIEIWPSPAAYLKKVELAERYLGAKKAVKSLRSLLESGSLSKAQIIASNLPEILGDRSDYQKLLAAY